MIEYLNWDSSFFNKKIGKIEISSRKNNNDNYFLEDILETGLKNEVRSLFNGSI